MFISGRLIVHAPVQMLELVRRLRTQQPGVHVVLLTNNNPLVKEQLASLAPEVVAAFGGENSCFCSSQFGASKPDPLVFQRLALTIGVRPDQMIVIDDSAANVRGARAAGIRSFHFNHGADSGQQSDEHIGQTAGGSNTGQGDRYGGGGAAMLEAALVAMGLYTSVAKL